MLTGDLRFGPNDPLFPSTLLKQTKDRRFAVVGLTRTSWQSTDPIRQIFRDAFGAAWNQNYGHDSEMTTFVGYGEVPGHRQAEIMRSLASPAPVTIDGLNIDALEAFVQSAKSRQPSQPKFMPSKPTT